MSLNAKIEWQLESAFVTVLSATPSLAGVTVRRHASAAAAPTYPIITVFCDGAQDSPFTQLQDYQEAIVTVSAFTYTAVDTTGSQIAEYVGKLRSRIYSTGFTAALTAAEGGLQVWGVRANGPSIVEDDEDIRRRAIVLTVYASADYGLDSSSSSSSTLSSSSSSSSTP